MRLFRSNANVYMGKIISVIGVLMSVSLSAQAATERSFTLFESGQVRPIAISQDNQQVFAANTPNNSVEIFDITESGLAYRTSVPVGLEPVALAVRNHNEVWVVNHLSDSISIIKLGNGTPYVASTLHVGDEPRDIVFAGRNNDRAFITTAHRGQNSPIDPQLTTPGVGRADVWVFEGNQVNSTVGGTPLNVITLFTDTPRALTVSPDGRYVYAAGFKTGNQTTTVWESRVTNSLGLPEPRVDSAGETQPPVGLIVKYDGTNWIDELNRSWNNYVKFSLPDRDVFVIDAEASPPAQVTGQNGYFSSVGTILFNMATNPVNGAVYVSNTEAINEKRFEGKGLTHDYGTVRGRFLQNRITVLKNGDVLPRHLNKHLESKDCCDADDKALTLAQPTDMVVSGDGSKLYVAAFGSGKIGVYNTATLENDSFASDDVAHIGLSAGGPSGVVLDKERGRLYVLTRFDNGISVIDTDDNVETSHTTMYNPEPASVVAGRPFLYDAAYTSADGNAACAGCHIYGDMDDLAWDLGDPDGTSFDIPGPVDAATGPWKNTPARINRAADVPTTFRALKGPMTTQSLRGMDNHGPMHWRGDRTGGLEEPSIQPNSGTYNEDLAFKKFNPAFVGLLGRDAQLTAEEMQAFTDFALQIMYPPNPIRALDNSLTEQQARGKDFFFNRRADTFFRCEGCHTTDPDGNREFDVAKPGFFGTAGEYNTGRIGNQVIKVAHFRNLYQKIGMFGMPATPELLPVVINGENNPFMGDQIRGFGFLHDGSQDTVFSFHKRKAFLQRDPGTNGLRDPGNEGFSKDIVEGDKERRDVESYLLAFPSNLAPVVGQQVTLSTLNNKMKDAKDRIDLLKARAEAGECELVAQQSNNRGYLYTGNDQFQVNKNNQMISDKDLRASTSDEGNTATFTCVPVGSGQRIALDRNENGILDGDES